MFDSPLYRERVPEPYDDPLRAWFVGFGFIEWALLAFAIDGVKCPQSDMSPAPVFWLFIVMVGAPTTLFAVIIGIQRVRRGQRSFFWWEIAVFAALPIIFIFGTPADFWAPHAYNLYDHISKGCHISSLF